jgi:hypothetical protein
LDFKYLSRFNEIQSSSYEIFSKPLGFLARFQVPVNWQELGLGGRVKLANDAHEPVPSTRDFKKQNRELSFARSVGQAGLVIQNTVDGEVLIDGRKLSVMINLISDSSVGLTEHET